MDIKNNGKLILNPLQKVFLDTQTNIINLIADKKITLNIKNKADRKI